MWENAVIINIKIRKTKSFAISVRVVTVLKLPTYGNHASIHSNLYMCTLKFWHLKVICNFNFSCPTFIYLIVFTSIHVLTGWKWLPKKYCFISFFVEIEGGTSMDIFYTPLFVNVEKRYTNFGPGGHSRRTSVEFLLTLPPPPLLVYVVVECPLIS